MFECKVHTLISLQSSRVEKQSATASREVLTSPCSLLAKSCNVLTILSPLFLKWAVFRTTAPRSLARAEKCLSTCAIRSSRYFSSDINLFNVKIIYVIANMNH